MANKKYKDIGDIYDKTIEECAEVIHIICKIKRFGVNNYHPKDKKKTPNYELLFNEMQDCRDRFKELTVHILGEAEEVLK